MAYVHPIEISEPNDGMRERRVARGVADNFHTQCPEEVQGRVC